MNQLRKLSQQSQKKKVQDQPKQINDLDIMEDLFGDMGAEVSPTQPKVTKPVVIEQTDTVTPVSEVKPTNDINDILDLF